MSEKVFMKDLIEDSSLAKRMDAWYEEAGVSIYKDGDKLTLKDLKDAVQGSYTLEELVEEYEFESANTQVPRRCVD